MVGRVLVADIGATHARFAIVAAGERAVKPAVWMTSLYESLEAAIADFLDRESAGDIDGVAVCAAGPVINDAIKMTNAPWTVTKEAVASATGVAAPILVNDLTATAHAIPALKADDVRQIGRGVPVERAPVAVLGPGTGLGVSGLVPTSGGDYVAISGEGGHVGLAPTNEREISIIFQLMMQVGYVSAESVLSGPGLETLYMAIAALEGIESGSRPSAPDILRMAVDRSDDPASRTANETINQFAAWLGQVAGDVGLTLGARGGIYIGGGIVRRWGEAFDEALFRRRFEMKGPMRDYMSSIPSYIIVTPEPALIGLSRLAAARF